MIDIVFCHLPQCLRVYLIEQGWNNKDKNACNKVDFKEQNEIPQIQDPKKWESRQRRLLTFDSGCLPVVTAFYEADLSIIKPIPIANDSPILICLQKNDSLRLKNFISHHRSIGIKNFAIIDNGSDDGSFEWLREQPDVFLFQTKTSYTSSRRDGWINRILSFFGDNKWYLVLDSDELLCYEDMENRPISDAINYLSNHSITRARAMLLDMYAEKGFFEHGDRNDYMEHCCYFDSDTYKTGPWDYHYILIGGPRKRVFKVNAMLTKYPLFYLSDKELLYKSHAMFPLKKNLNTPCHFVLKHYKFLPGDKQRYEAIANRGNYHNGSIEYKKYIQVMNSSELSFFYDASVRYESSASLRSINPYTPILW